MKTTSPKLRQLRRFIPLFLIAIALGAICLTACGKRTDAEKAGEKIDDSVEDTKDGAKDLFDKDGPAENAGEKIDDKLDEK
jgi:hypothetical protein